MRKRYLSMLAIGALLNACTQKRANPAPEKPATSFTSHLRTVRNWHGYHVSNSATNALTDTSFAITVVNDSEISLFGNGYVVDSIDSAGGIIYFGVPAGQTVSYEGGSYSGSLSAWTFYTYGSGFGLAYFFRNDSVSFVMGAVSHSRVVKDVRYTY